MYIRNMDDNTKLYMCPIYRVIFNSELSAYNPTPPIRRIYADSNISEDWD